MKRAAILIICLFACLGIAYAHSGDTDANGGHYDRTTGEYHYHHGYPAHQHINGECPYAFADQTQKNSGKTGQETRQGAAEDAQASRQNRWNVSELLFIAFCAWVFCKVVLGDKRKQKSRNRLIATVKWIGLAVLMFPLLPVVAIGYILMKHGIIPFSAGEVVAFTALAIQGISILVFYLWGKKGKK